MFENPTRGRQARNFTTNVPKILDLKSSSEQIFSENCRWVALHYQRLTLESWFSNFEQTPLNRSQKLPAQYKRLIDGIKQN